MHYVSKELGYCIFLLQIARSSCLLEASEDVKRSLCGHRDTVPKPHQTTVFLELIILNI